MNKLNILRVINFKNRFFQNDEYFKIYFDIEIKIQWILWYFRLKLNCFSLFWFVFDKVDSIYF